MRRFNRVFAGGKGPMIDLSNPDRRSCVILALPSFAVGIVIVAATRKNKRPLRILIRSVFPVLLLVLRSQDVGTLFFGILLSGALAGVILGALAGLIHSGSS